jgi:carboxypeptidase Taq
MIEYKDKIKAAETTVKRLRAIETLSNLLRLDAAKHITKNGVEYRGELAEYLAQERKRILGDLETGELVQSLAALPEEAFASIEDKALVRYLTHKHRAATLAPLALQEKMASLTFKAEKERKEALEANDFGLVRDTLKEIFDVKAEIARHIDPEKPVMEVLMNLESEEYTTLAQAAELVRTVRDGTMEIFQKIQQTGRDFDNSFLEAIPLDPAKLQAFTDEVLKASGFDFDSATTEKGYFDACFPIGPRDMRANANFDIYDSGIWGMIHEAGHARYAYASDPELIRRGLWGGMEGSLHESQGRFYEQVLGKSLPFWQAFYPRFQDYFPAYQNIGLEDFYRAINRVTPCLYRLPADEVTYNLHIALRFEMENDYYNGKLTIEEFPESWCDRIEQYLGIRPKDHREGLLQDVHWFIGAVGYYQYYLVGNVYDGQFLRRMEEDLPDVWEAVAAGNLAPMDSWLVENIHRHSKRYTPGEIIRRIAGTDPDPQPFLAYLDRKYKALYGY